jgi:hypothetical protein
MHLQDLLMKGCLVLKSYTIALEPVNYKETTHLIN